MIITIASMINLRICEPPYFLKALDLIKNELDDSYHFIIARTNISQEIGDFKNCIKKDKKNILILLSDEAGIKPYFLDDLFLVFRTYSNKSLYDDDKIFSVPCGYSCGYGGFFGKTDFLYTNMEEKKAPLIEREYDIFYSGQFSYNRISFLENLNKIKNKFQSFVNITDGFAKGLELDEYYKLM